MGNDLTAVSRLIKVTLRIQWLKKKKKREEEAILYGLNCWTRTLLPNVVVHYHRPECWVYILKSVKSPQGRRFTHFHYYYSHMRGNVLCEGQKPAFDDCFQLWAVAIPSGPLLSVVPREAATPWAPSAARRRRRNRHLPPAPAARSSPCRNRCERSTSSGCRMEKR